MVADLETLLMDWNKLVILASQCVVVIVLGVCVALGHDSVMTDALLAVSGSLAGTGLYAQVKVIKANVTTYKSTEDAQ
jgi:exosome complex RNA-binding protein Rrp42 (RNase PH superfamily)